MAGFGKSFSDAFEKTATVAAAGTLDALKEKIKEDVALKKEEATAADDMANAFKIAEATGDAKLIKAITDLAYTQDSATGKLKANKITPGMAKSASTLATGGFNLMQRVKALDERTKSAYLMQIGDDGKPKLVDTITNEIITDPSKVKGNAVVFKETLTPEQIGSRALASREATTENPQLDQQTQSAIAALDFINPRIESANKILNSIGKKQFENLVTQVQIGANNELIVPPGPLEDLVAEINDIKITGFGIAGSAYTGNERQVVEGSLNPIGKSFERYKRDLNRNKDFFSARAKAGTMGLKEARKVAKKNSSRAIEGSDDTGNNTNEFGLDLSQWEEVTNE